jgi:hypothetical protein
MTEHAPVLPGDPAARARRAAVARFSAFAAGIAAACLSLGVLGALVLLLWIGSPFPDSGLGGALHVGAGLWLLAQGADLVRTHALSGHSAPIGVTPLLLTALPAWLLHRAAASAAATRRDDGIQESAVAAGWVLGGYVAVASGVAAYAGGGSVHVDLLGAAVYVPLFALAVVAAGAWAGCGRPPLVRWFPRAGDIAAALRAGGIATGVLMAGGALLGAASLVWHAGAVGRTFEQLSGPLAGRIAVLLVALALAPNVAVWGAAYGLGTGFAVGAGSVVAPAGASGYPLLPGFPLLAALPGQGGGTAVTWAAVGVPVLAGCAAGWSAGRAGRAPARAVLVAAGAAVSCGAAVGLLAAWSAGPLGTSRMSTFGPSELWTPVAALAWTLTLAIPTSLALTWRPTWRPTLLALTWRPTWRPTLPALTWRPTWRPTLPALTWRPMWPRRIPKPGWHLPFAARRDSPPLPPPPSHPPTVPPPLPPKPPLPPPAGD